MNRAAGVVVWILCSLGGVPQWALAASPTALPSAAPEAANFPIRPIRFIIPAPPGGTTGIIGRLVGQRLTDVLKQPVVVDHRGGAGGVVAAEITAKAAPDGYTLLAGGQIQMSFAGMVPVQPLIRGGRVRALAVTTAQRIPAIPDLPTVAESGLSGYEVVGWYGFLAPAGVPKPIVAKLHAEIVRILRDPEITKRLTNDGAEVVASTPDEFEKFLRADVVKWAKVVKASGARLD